jgi:hypothetical protein
VNRVTTINNVEIVDLLSSALDEVYRLRRALAYEARVSEAHYEGFKTYPKSRRTIAEEQVRRMRLAVTSSEAAYAGVSRESMRREASNCGLETLTTWEFADEVNTRSA